MSGLYFRGFVCDEDSLHLRDSLPASDIFTLAEIGITLGRGSPDEAVVRHARESGCIVVTGNKSDFVTEMRLAAQRCTPAECFEGGGMITVPAGIQRLRFNKITNDLWLTGQRVRWMDVYTCNLHVALHRDGKVVVNQLPVCEFFLKGHAAECEDCQRLGIGA